MIIYILLAAFTVGLLGGAGGMNWWNDAAIARHEAAQVRAQAKIDEQSAKIESEAANKLIDMQAAYQAGEANAKVVTKTIYAKGQAYVASVPAFSNPVCTVPAAGLQLLASARSGVLIAADLAGIDAALSGAGSPASGQPGRGAIVQGPLPAQPSGSGTVAGVPQQQSGTDPSNPVQGQSAARRPKPSPIR